MTGARLLIFPLSATLLLNACVAVPIPHDRQISPEVSGTVRDSITGQPVAGATVTLTIEAAKTVDGVAIATSSRTAADGSFHTVLTERAIWYTLVLGPAEGFCGASVVIAHEAYESTRFEVNQFRGAAADGKCNGYKVTKDASLRPKTPNSTPVAH